MKKNIVFLIKEIIPITLGILIALFINNWNERQKDKKYIAKIMISINEEMAETSQSIAKNIPNEKKLIDTLDAYLLDDKMSLLEVVVKGDGLHMPSIKTNAWKSISNSKIELLDYNLISALASIEEGKALLQFQAQNIANYLYQNAEDTGKFKKMTLKLMMWDVIRNVTDLDEEIQNLKKQIAVTPTKVDSTAHQ
ncbi:MAG: hypothetical protein CR968_06425 [Flavobacteriia bacterium]|nr:MAG: hypothetical protein CR968_06425 [Flavobacteriia bacterium]